MRHSKRLSSVGKLRSVGGALARLFVGIVSAVVLIASPLCIAQALAEPMDCEATMIAATAGGDHQDHSQTSSKPDCAVGCRLLPQSGPQIGAPDRVVYEDYFEAEPRTLNGIKVDPDVPPPRWAV